MAISNNWWHVQHPENSAFGAHSESGMTVSGLHVPKSNLQHYG